MVYLIQFCLLAVKVFVVFEVDHITRQEILEHCVFGELFACDRDRRIKILFDSS